MENELPLRILNSENELKTLITDFGKAKLWYGRMHTCAQLCACLYTCAQYWTFTCFYRYLWFCTCCGNEPFAGGLPILVQLAAAWIREPAMAAVGTRVQDILLPFRNCGGRGADVAVFSLFWMNGIGSIDTLAFCNVINWSSVSQVSPWSVVTCRVLCLMLKCCPVCLRNDAFWKQLVASPWTFPEVSQAVKKSVIWCRWKVVRYG